MFGLRFLHRNKKGGELKKVNGKGYLAIDNYRKNLKIKLRKREQAAEGGNHEEGLSFSNSQRISVDLGRMRNDKGYG